MGIRRIDVHVAGFTSPERDVVERKAVGVGAAIDGGSRHAVADDEGFLKELRRLFVVQFLRHRHGEAERQCQQCCQSFFHVLLVAISVVDIIKRIMALK